MFKLIVALSLLLASHALAADAAHLALATEVIELLGTKEAVETNFKASTKTILDQAAKFGDGELTKAISSATDAFFTANFKWETLQPIIAAAYVEQFSPEELQAIAAFYKTPAGQKLASSRTPLNTKVDEAVNQQTNEKLPGLRNDLMKIVSEHMAKKGVGQ
jgi:hypothetical protein